MMIPTSATEPLPNPVISGDKSSGIINATPDSEICIESQVVTFNLTDYPHTSDFSQYKESNVITEYTLVNPTDSTEEVIIALPMGMRIEYGKCDLDRFELKINGEAIESETRYRLNQVGDYTHYFGQYDFTDIDISSSTSNGLHEGYAPWRLYEISLDPDERATVTLTAPVYPDVNTSYSPYTYFYSYYFSPYVGWKGYGSVDVVINTDYYIANAFHDSFTETEDGYQLHIDSLLTKIDAQSSSIKAAVEFELCSVEIHEAVKEEPDNSGIGILIILMLIIMPFVALWEGIEDVVEIIVNAVKDIFTK
ncbi:MAG: hypothetical protein IKU99_04430, partial [Clostridia bacterium]|nr:hypothetical protein [Clostridia bacterium]